MDPMLNPASVDLLLDRLCIKFGFCLPPEARLQLRNDPPLDVATFTDAVFVAEGLDPSSADRQRYRSVRDMIQDAFRCAEDEAHGRSIDPITPRRGADPGPLSSFVRAHPAKKASAKTRLRPGGPAARLRRPYIPTGKGFRY